MKTSIFLIVFCAVSLTACTPRSEREVGSMVCMVVDGSKVQIVENRVANWNGDYEVRRSVYTDPVYVREFEVRDCD